MKTIFECDICKRSYNTSEDAFKCETEHTILKSEDFKWYWYIPFIAWILVPMFLFTKKNAIIIFEKNFKGELKSLWLSTGLILLALISLLLSIYCSQLK